jgi:hypothetical protein
MSYRVIPFIGKIKDKQSAVEVSKQLESLINEGERGGWIFQEISSVNIEVQPGCLAGFFGARVSYERFDMVVFKWKE